MFKTCFVLTMLWSFVSFPALVIAAEADQRVHYDRATDRLTITVQMVSLSKVLAHVGAASGIKVLMDPSAERSVTLSLRDQPLESGLKQLVRGLNYAMFFEKSPAVKGRSSGAPLLVAIKVLPHGKQDESALAPLLTLEKEARARADSGAAIQNFSTQRWQARMAKLPPEKRQRLEKQIREHRARRKEMEERRAARRAERRAAQRQDDLEDLKESQEEEQEEERRQSAESVESK